MSYFDDASLVMIPSGYKDQKVYSVKPLDGSGDLTFSRASSATRVASNGLIEKVRTNLITYSQAFDNAAWTKGGVGTYTSAVTTGFTDPTGGSNAQRWLATIATTSDRAFVRQLLTLTNGIPYNVSFWIKSNTASAQELYVQFQGGAVATVTATTSWTRVSYTQTTSVTSVFVGVDAKQLATDVLIYGYQVEVGDVATDYIATTSAAVSVGPVSGLPRLDYLNSTCPRLLLEPQRSSLVLYSEQLNNAAWIKQTVTISANSSVSPDGSTNADKIAINNGISGGYVYQSISTTSSTVYTTSFFIKAAGVNFTKFFSNVTGSYVDAVINLTTGAITNSTFATTPTTTNYGNGWWRVSYTETSGGGTVPIYVDGGSTSTGGGITGNGTDGILIWGAQIEAGAYATSYIPTLGTSVTRVADAASKTGISSIIGQTEGTMFIDADYIASTGGNYNTLMLLTPSAGAGYVVIDRYPNNTVVCEYNQGGSQAKITSVATYGSQRLKIAFAYKANDFVAYVNGVQIGTDNSGTTGLSLTNLVMPYEPNVPFGGRVSQALLFKTRLTNAQLAELTTL